MDRKSRTSRSATLEETNEELSLWKQICTSLVKLEGVQKETDTILDNINDLHSHCDLDQGLPSNISQQLKEYYRGGIELSEKEASTIHDVVEKLTVLIALREASEQNQKRKKRKSEADELKTSSQSSKKAKPSSHNGTIPAGTSVAARQPKQKDKNEEWILATVINYHSDKNKYQVEDVDQDEFGQKPRYMLQPRNVIPVPDADEARESPEMEASQVVLALYPGTTCFYKATVVTPPSKNKDHGAVGDYKVQFEDDNNEVKYVMPEHVLEIPKTK